MTPADLLTVIQADQTLVDMMVALDDIGIADVLNTPSVTVSKETFITKRTIFGWFGILRGTQIMVALRTAAASQHELAPALNEIKSLLDNVESGGLDIGHSDTAQLVPLLISFGIITVDEGDEFIASGQRLISPAMYHFNEVVTPVDVKFARRLFEATGGAFSLSGADVGAP